MSSRRCSVLLSAVLVLVGLFVLSAPSASALRTPHAPHGFTRAIEGYAPYQPQHRCRPHVRPGTEKLGKLLVRTYRHTTFYTVRPCDGSVSEHFDGRAIDWMVSAAVGWQHHDARLFLHWLLKQDRWGHWAAMARRLGVMYVIFNNRMWGAWDHRWHDYNHCMSRKKQKNRYDNACHRTHVHISLDWRGARADTSFWTGHVGS